MKVGNKGTNSFFSELFHGSFIHVSFILFFLYKNVVFPAQGRLIILIFLLILR